MPTPSCSSVRAIDAVRDDKAREAAAGFDGTWVAHPDVVTVARAEFDKVLLSRPNQIDRLRENVDVMPTQLLDVVATPGHVTEAGLRGNLNIAFQYISFWLGGRADLTVADLAVDPPCGETAGWPHDQPRARVRPP
jgi:malate synthase